MTDKQFATSAEQTCVTCGELKPLSEFHKRKETAFGYRRECRDCRCRRQQRYSKTDEGKYVQVKADQRRNKLFPERRAARSALYQAVVDGVVKRQPCFMCGDEAEAHHPDYSRPLDVVWLCPTHHKQAHQSL